MPGQIVRLEGEALGFHLLSKGWEEGYVVILNLAMLHRVFATEKEAKQFADSIPVGWDPQFCFSTESIPGSTE